jgi:catechol 2,3-dioxygenase-like lactoylglutathione lyase family enzyme
MSLTQLAHYSVRTADLGASRRFYVEVLGLREGARPRFEFPGAWLYLGDDEAAHGVVHLIGEGAGSVAYLGARAIAAGTGAFDHIAFLATGWAEQRARFETHGVAHVARRVPGLGLFQVFVTDPSGVTVELNYLAAEVPAA